MNRPETIPKIAKICVYCGSGAGTDPAFVEAATALGTAMAKAGIGLVYGGGDMAQRYPEYVKELGAAGKPASGATARSVMTSSTDRSLGALNGPTVWSCFVIRSMMKSV